MNRISLLTVQWMSFVASILFSVAIDAQEPSSSNRETLEGVQPPAWVLEGVCKVFLPLEDFGAITEASQHGATVLHAGGPASYFPLRRDDPTSGVPEPERTKILQGIAHAKRLGMRVVLGISPYAPIEMVRTHPEWVLHATDDSKVRDQVFDDLNSPERIGLRALPLNTPFGEHLIDCLLEIMHDYQVDGFSFDGCYHAPINFSPYEKNLYHRETGRNVPERIDLNHSDYKAYLLWADQKLEAWYRRLGVKLKAANPEAAIYTWTTNAGRYGHFLTSPRVMSARMNRLIDCPVQEWWLDEVNLGSTVVPNFGAAYVRAVSGGKVGASEPYLMSHGNPYSTDSFPAHELKVRCLGAMTNGSFTPLAQMAGKEATLETLSEIAKRKEWFTQLSQEQWAALLVSESTRQFYAHGNIIERWLSHALGFYRVGIEEHLPMNLITDEDLTSGELAKYKVLILPNTACLSDRQLETIRRFVREGGGLIATCETSLCNELGEPRNDFGLKDLFQTRYDGRSQSSNVDRALDANFAIAINDQYWAQRGNVGAIRFSDFPDSIFAANPRLKKNLPNYQATFKGPVVRTHRFEGSMKPSYLYFPEGSRDAFPGGAYGEYEKGRVVYFSTGLDAAYFSYAFPYQRIVLSQAIHWAAGSEYPIRVEAPMCVQSTFWKQGTRSILHLWNGLNTTADHGLQESEVPLREESIPIQGIKIFVTGTPPKRARFEPEGVELVPQSIGNEYLLDLPPIEIHNAVVIEQ